MRLKLMPEDAYEAMNEARDASAWWGGDINPPLWKHPLWSLRDEPVRSRWVLPVYDGDPLDVDCSKEDERYYEWRLAWGPELYHCDEIHVAIVPRESPNRAVMTIRRTHRDVHRALAGDTTGCRWCEVTP